MLAAWLQPLSLTMHIWAAPTAGPWWSTGWMVGPIDSEGLRAGPVGEPAVTWLREEVKAEADGRWSTMV